MTSGRRILVVEDEVLIAMDIEAELESRGWEVVGLAGTADSALKHLDAEDISCALLDINLRGSDSFAIAEALDSRNIPFVFLSGDDGTSRPDSLKHKPLLSKPIDYRQMHRILEGETDSSH